MYIRVSDNDNMALQTKKELFLVWSYLVDVRTAALIIRGDIALRKTAFLSHLYVKTIILPRQARDKHRETQKAHPFLRW